MSKKQNVTDKPEQKEEKIVTRYDRRLQRRKQQEEKEKRDKAVGLAVGIVVLVGLVCLVASFPIRTWLATNETYVTIGGDKVTRVEFDYNYNLTKNNYLNQYGSYLSYFGVNPSADLSTQMYSETLSWKDYFEQLTVDNLKQNKALLREAKNAGFTYDTKEDYAEFEENLKTQAAEAGENLNKFLKTTFGPYATMGRLAGTVKEGMTANAYYEKVSEEKTPSDEDIKTDYDENTDEYDSVDYRMTVVNAELPTAPAGGEQTTDDGTEADAGTEGAEGETQEPYEPTEEEISAAMDEARVKADAEKKTVAESGELYENAIQSEIASVPAGWLFDASRKAGDTTVLEDRDNNRYYVVAFEKRYLDESPTVDVRVIVSSSTDGQTILDEWKNGEATEESFIELCKKYSEDEVSKANDGLYEAVTGPGMEAVMSDWLFAPERKAGETTAVTTSEGTHYVMYYVGQNVPEWKLSIQNKLLGERMTEYLDQITEGLEVKDDKGRLNYLKVEASQAAESTETTAPEEGSGTESQAEEDAQAESPAAGEGAEGSSSADEGSAGSPPAEESTAGSTAAE